MGWIENGPKKMRPDYLSINTFPPNPTILLLDLSVLSIDGQKHNWTMVSNASPGTTAPKMNKSFVHMAHVSSNRACTQAQDGYLKRPHPTIIDGDMRWDSGWFLGGFGVGGRRTRNYLGRS
jgi:hypothetical protein